MDIFNNEADNVKRVEELGIEYRFKCLEEKIPPACHRLGLFLDVVKQEFEKAAKVFKSNCEENKFGDSCHSYGNYLIQGKLGEKPDFKESLRYHVLGCEYGYPPACYNAGVIHSSDVLEKHNIHQAAADFKKACDGCHGMGCYFLSSIYLTGKDGVKKDMKKAIYYADKACEYDNWKACFNLTRIYKIGDGVPKDESLSEKYKKRTELLRDSASGVYVPEKDS